MKKTQIPAKVLSFAILTDMIPAKIPIGFDRRPVMNFYHLLHVGVTSLDENDPLHSWLENIIKCGHVDALIFLLQTQKLVEEQIQDTLG